jgi:hypothetical protein
MSEQIPEGRCSLCDEQYTKQGMSNHLRACRSDHVEDVQDTFHLRAEGAYRSDFWVHFEIAADATLQSLDQFLRYLWLECCGHLSAFTIGGVRYAAQPMGELDERNMNVTLSTMLDDGVEFTYKYDFGATTELSLRVVERDDHRCGFGVTANYGDMSVRLLARNEMPDIRCGVCGDEATAACSAHPYDEEGWLCNGCQADHECGPELFLPVVNSPRVRICAYTG